MRIWREMEMCMCACVDRGDVVEDRDGEREGEVGGSGVVKVKRREQSERGNRCRLVSQEFPGARPRRSWNLDTFLLLNSKNFPLFPKNPKLALLGFSDL